MYQSFVISTCQEIKTTFSKIKSGTYMSGRYISYGPIMEIMELFTVVILQTVRYALSLNVSFLSGNYFFKYMFLM